MLCTLWPAVLLHKHCTSAIITVLFCTCKALAAKALNLKTPSANCKYLITVMLSILYGLLIGLLWCRWDWCVRVTVKEDWGGVQRRFMSEEIGDPQTTQKISSKGVWRDINKYISTNTFFTVYTYLYYLYKSWQSPFFQNQLHPHPGKVQ